MSDLPEWALKDAEAALADLADESPDYFELRDRIAAARVKASGRYTEAFVDAAVAKARAEGVQQGRKEMAEELKHGS